MIFRDPETKQIEEEVEHALELYSFEDILEHNDLTPHETLVILVRDGYVVLPEIQQI